MKGINYTFQTHNTMNHIDKPENQDNYFAKIEMLLKVMNTLK